MWRRCGQRILFGGTGKHLLSIDFSDWLKEKAERHERQKMLSRQGNLDYSCTSKNTRTKHGTKLLASAAESSQRSSLANYNKTSVTTTSKCAICKAKHPLWKCLALHEKTHWTRKGRSSSLTMFLLLHFFRQCPRPRNYWKEGYTSSYNALLHGAERIFQHKPATKQQSEYEKSCAKAGNKSRNHDAESSGQSFVSDVKHFLQIAEVDVFSIGCFEQVRVLWFNLQSLLDVWEIG